MSDCISRDAAMEIVKRTSGDYAAAFSEIRKLPAADAEPVRHGQWFQCDDDWNSLTTFQCSVCGEEYCFECDEDILTFNYKYCPNCGAKMCLEDETNDD